jgi:hypothetical protein
MRLILALERYGGLFFCVSQKTPDQNIAMIRWILLALLLSIAACRDTQTNPAEPGLWVVYATALREAPGEKSAELIQLEPGDPLTDLGQVSSFISGIILNDTLRNEPWLQVQTKGGRQGWVFAGALRPCRSGYERRSAVGAEQTFHSMVRPHPGTTLGILDTSAAAPKRQHCGRFFSVRDWPCAIP